MNKCKSGIHRSRKRRRNIASAAAIALIIVLSGFTIWALNERRVAEIQKNEAIQAKQAAQNAKETAEKARVEADMQKTRAEENEKTALAERKKALNAKQIAENELYQNIKNSLAIELDKMNVLYKGVDNPVTITISGIPSDRIKVSISSPSKIRGEKGKYLVNPSPTYNYRDTIIVLQNGRSIKERITVSVKPAWITVFAEIKKGVLDSIGTKYFRVYSLPEPTVYFAGKTGGIIPRATAAAQSRSIHRCKYGF